MNLLDLWPVLAFLILQLAIAIWWAATTTAQIAALKDNSVSSRNNGERLARIEERLENIDGTLKSVSAHIHKRRRT